MERAGPEVSLGERRNRLGGHPGLWSVALEVFVWAGITELAHEFSQLAVHFSDLCVGVYYFRVCAARDVEELVDEVAFEGGLVGWNGREFALQDHDEVVRGKLECCGQLDQRAGSTAPFLVVGENLPDGEPSHT